jgi:hypothetical protein
LTFAFGYLASRIRAQLSDQKSQGFDRRISENARRMMDQGKQIFSYDAFGDEIYWTDKLKLHHAIQGIKFGGVGAGVSPKNRTRRRLEGGHGCITSNVGQSDQARQGRPRRSGNHMGSY